MRLRLPNGYASAVAAVAFAAVLYKVVRSGAVSSALSSIVTSALHAI
ncbi:DUF4244 domain-containing protein [Jatrophihabitans cynanchi]|uniref:DUF4244 domain-containing protein n=1 Tax=Jatrophihabitans cynanchi TaxID=2944128 RepID=A0ABY7K399_9ACTN|nr:DUF4244 domain-containing protein [Jatrophihabitans sp. SB3-54]WAX59149.1 DUF4244 domain-containing protein [Jatrophihabitans sp. SB3-54]